MSGTAGKVLEIGGRDSLEVVSLVCFSSPARPGFVITGLLSSSYLKLRRFFEFSTTLRRINSLALARPEQGGISSTLV